MGGSFGKIKEFFGFVEELDIESKPTVESTPIIRPFKGAITPPSANKSLTMSEIKIEEPRVYEDSLSIATHLRDNKPVIINLKYLDASSGKRLIDFVCGTAYAINGHMMKIGENIFLFTPEHVLIAEHSSDKGQYDVQLDNDDRESFFKRAAL